MKKIIAVLVLALGFACNSSTKEVKKVGLEQAKEITQKVVAKEVKTVGLEQTKGEFTQKAITLSEGTYIFEIENSNVGTDVGFVLLEKGKSAADPKNHIKNAYVTSPVKNNSKSNSKEVTLTKGEYTYFCPLNKTPEYTLTVK